MADSFVIKRISLAIG